MGFKEIIVPSLADDTELLTSIELNNINERLRKIYGLWEKSRLFWTDKMDVIIVIVSHIYRDSE